METQVAATIKITGMHCGACQKIIEKKLMKISGILEVNAELDSDVFITANRSISLDEVKKSLEGTDYQVS